MFSGDEAYLGLSDIEYVEYLHRDREVLVKYDVLKKECKGLLEAEQSQKY